jgi:diadenosine tetraphosphatase ApaH/serine/threonine PP2A family protein phosphatase
VKILVVTDLHANWWALQAVIADAASDKCDDIVCCGDMVGYNARPKDVLDWTRSNCSAVIRGNHDKAIAGIGDLEWFNDIAQEAARWSMATLPPEQLQYLRDLKPGPIALGRGQFQICHGSPRDEDEYVVSARDALDSFRDMDCTVTFFGHTHVQGGFFFTRGKVGSLPSVGKSHNERVLELEPDVCYLVNPGSVGQPRDGDPRAAYLIFDTESRTVALRRVAYPIEETAREIQQAGLPDVLAYRLFRGM